MAEIKLKKQNDNTWIAHDSLTSDPVAVVKSRPNAYGNKRVYDVDWHPAMRHMYQEHLNTFALMNIGRHESLNDASNRIETKYGAIVDSPLTHKQDPLRAERLDDYEHTSGEGDSKVTKTFAKFAVHHHDTGEHIGSISIAKNYLANVGTGTHLSAGDIKYSWAPGTAPSPARLEILKRKHPPTDVTSLMHMMRYHAENKEKDPRFIGSHSSGQSKYYKTTLSREDAAKDFVKHLMASSPSRYTDVKVDMIGPHHVMIEKKPTGDRYSSGFKEMIDASNEGELHHHTMQHNGADHYDSKKINEVIE